MGCGGPGGKGAPPSALRHGVELGHWLLAELSGCIPCRLGEQEAPLGSLLCTPGLPQGCGRTVTYPRICLMPLQFKLNFFCPNGLLSLGTVPGRAIGGQNCSETAPCLSFPAWTQRTPVPGHGSLSPSPWGLMEVS